LSALTVLTLLTGKFEIYHQRFIFGMASWIKRDFVLMSCQVKTSGQCQLRDKQKKHLYFSIVALPIDAMIVDHAVECNHNQHKRGG
jgi:hypothetical protein